MPDVTTFTISDGLIILATLLSPLIAVQVQKWIEGATEKRIAQRQVFYDLMATRATRVAPKHVEALNRIDLEFSNSANAKNREVLDCWRIYADHLNNPPADQSNKAASDRWVETGDGLFVDLLHALSGTLGYSFDKVSLKRGVYYPQAHGHAELRKEVFEEAMVRLVTGNGALNMKVVEFPFSEEDAALNRKLQEGILNAFSEEEGALKTKAITPHPDSYKTTKNH